MADFTFFDLASLGTPEIIETLDSEAILAERKAKLVSLMQAAGIAFDVSETETDPSIVCLEEGSYDETVLRARGNDIARQRYLYWARGKALDHLGAYYDCPRMVGEGDDRYVDRIITGIQGRSTGGTAARYRYVAMSASLRVADAKVFTIGTDPTVHVAILATDNSGLADQALIALVQAALGADDVRMVNDRIVVRSAVVDVVPIVAALTLLPTTSEDILTTLETDLPPAWPGGLGRDLTRDWIRAQLMVPGVYGVRLVAPTASRVVDPYSAVAIGPVNLTIAGRAY